MLTLGYWSTRSLAQSIRLLLESVGADYNERRYAVGPGPDYDKSDWLNDRDHLGLDFPNLPYLIDGDIRLTESDAILRYLDSKHGLVSPDIHVQTRSNMVNGVASELMRRFMTLCYSAQFEQQRSAYEQVFLPQRLGAIDRFLLRCGPDGWVAGARAASADFLLYEAIDQHRSLAPQLIDRFTAIGEFSRRVESLERIAAYRSSPRFLRGPIHNRMARFGATAE